MSVERLLITCRLIRREVAKRHLSTFILNLFQSFCISKFSCYYPHFKPFLPIQWRLSVEEGNFQALTSWNSFEEPRIYWGCEMVALNLIRHLLYIKYFNVSIENIVWQLKEIENYFIAYFLVGQFCPSCFLWISWLIHIRVRCAGHIKSKERLSPSDNLWICWHLCLPLALSFKNNSLFICQDPRITQPFPKWPFWRW